MTDKKLEGIKLLLEERMLAYDILRLAYVEEPSREFVKTLLNDKLMNSFPFIEEEEEISAGCREISEYLTNTDVLEESQYQKLHWDYTKMFIGPYELIAPPWESAYTSKERLLFQETTLQVRNTYLKYNFIPRHYPHEADDHIGLELDYLYQLTKQTLEAGEKNKIQRAIQLLEEQNNFIKEHLQIWISEFTEKIINGAETPFYRGMAKVLKGFIIIEPLIIKELIETLKS